jgi:hypothetical protein
MFHYGKAIMIKVQGLKCWCFEIHWGLVSYVNN